MFVGSTLSRSTGKPGVIPAFPATGQAIAMRWTSRTPLSDATWATRIAGSTGRTGTNNTQAGNKERSDAVPAVSFTWNTDLPEQRSACSGLLALPVHQAVRRRWLAAATARRLS